MKLRPLIFALSLAAPLCAAATPEPTTALALARAEVQAMALPAEADDAAEGAAQALRDLHGTRVRLAHLVAEVPTSPDLSAAWERLDRDLGALAEAWRPHPDESALDDYAHALAAAHAAADAVRADTLQFVGTADGLIEQ